MKKINLKKGCKDKAYLYNCQNSKDEWEHICACIIHKPMGWKRVR